MKHRTISLLASLALIAGALGASAQTGGGGSAGGGASGSGSTGSGSSGSGMTGPSSTGSGTSGARSSFSLREQLALESKRNRDDRHADWNELANLSARRHRTAGWIHWSARRTTGQPTTGSGTDQTGQSQQTGQDQSGSSDPASEPTARAAVRAENGSAESAISKLRRRQGAGQRDGRLPGRAHGRRAAQDP